jgi:hypothetical protein
MKIEPRCLGNDYDHVRKNWDAAVTLLDLYTMNLAAPAQGIKVGMWITTPVQAIRVVAGGNPDNVADRVAYIGVDQPWVRIRPFGSYPYPPYGDRDADHMNWCSGLPGDSAHDPHSRAWCDRMLIALGYDLEDLP